MNSEIKKIIQDSISVKNSLPLEEIELACNKVIELYRKGGKLLVCGNGGSAADAQHMAGEFINRFKIERTPLPCIALSTDTSTLTAISNDYSFDEVFSKQVQAHGNPGDILIGISTSGNSKNIIRAVEIAKEKNMFTICLLGKDGGILKDKCDLPIMVSSDDTPRIQESHILIIHILCEIVEKKLFG